LPSPSKSATVGGPPRPPPGIVSAGVRRALLLSHITPLGSTPHHSLPVLPSSTRTLPVAARMTSGVPLSSRSAIAGQPSVPSALFHISVTITVGGLPGVHATFHACLPLTISGLPSPSRSATAERPPL
jgi:hypothetical protein